MKRALQPHERISAAIRATTTAGRTALVPYITAGYPQKDQFIATLRAIAAEADVVEIGVPFSDPMADGVTIQRASHAAIASGVSLRWILDELTRSRRPSTRPIVLMSYLNPLLNFGYEQSGRRRDSGRRVWLHRSGPADRGKRGLQARDGRAGSRADPAGDAGHAA